ncbi:MAG: hybrid sensor histidine kinase/response regulator [Myxococcota bacterium]
MNNEEHILIIDDSAPARDTFAAQLARCDYTLSFAESAPQAREQIVRQRPDLILLDVMLPQLDGIEFCAELRQDPRLERIPIIMVTALDAREDVLRGLSAGANEFLTKPVFAPELRTRIRNLLDAKRYHDLLHQRHEQALAEIDRLRDQLLHMDRLATLGTFAAGVGHELNNISTVLVTGSSLMLVDLERRLTVDRADLEMICDAAKHVAEQAKTIMNFAAPKATERPEPLDVRQVVESVATMLRIAGRTKRLSVRLDLPDRPVWLHWAKTQLEQLLINLCANAADAIDSYAKHGHVDISVRQDELAGTVTIVVEDDGPGMPPEVIARVFEPFFTTKPPGKGTGLGLPVIKRLVETHGGTISIHSSVGEGTRVGLQMPTEPPREGMEAGEESV